MDERFGAEQDLVIGMSELAGESTIRCRASIQGPATAVAAAPAEAIAVAIAIAGTSAEVIA